MARHRSADPDALLPVSIHGGDAERGLWLAPRPQLPVEVAPYGEVALQRLRAGWLERSEPWTRRVRAARLRYQLAIGDDRRYNPRGPSGRISRAAPQPVDVVLDRLGTAMVDVRSPGITRSGPPRWEPDAREHRMPVQLLIPWSRPALPMWLAVQGARGETSTLHLSLRSRHRLRYPARYFSAGQRALGDLVDALAPAGQAR